MDFPKRNNARFQVSCPPELLKQMDEFADAHFLTRSGLICVAVSSYINAQRVGEAMEKLYALLAKIVDEKGSIEDEKQLEKVYEAVRLIRPDFKAP